MKALEMLYRDKKWIEEECDISKITIERVQTTIKDLVEINEAIAELEALQQPKSCDGCVKRSTQYCPVRGLFIYTYDEFCCNKHERKIDER